MGDTARGPATKDRPLTRIFAEFMEMPGLRLTMAQAQRLWGLDPIVCSGLLSDLVDAGFLVKFPDSTYGRRSDGPQSRARTPMARARLESSPGDHAGLRAKTPA